MKESSTDLKSGKTENEAERDSVLGAIMGLCVADAMGVPVEFKNREERKEDPVTEMRGYGTFNLPPGTWSDDSSLTLCLADSLARGLDYKDIMENFSKWLHEGEFTPHGESFDVGNGTYKAIMRFGKGTDPLLCGGKEERDNGNGSLMRILPLVFHLRKNYGSEFASSGEAMQIICNVSSLTHAHRRSVIACGLYLSIASELLDGKAAKEAVRSGLVKAAQYYACRVGYAEELEHYRRLADKEFASLPEDSIKSSGYVVDTLEAAIWCLLNTETYKECVLKAVNLGEDTDTVGAVAGGLAGIHYGYKSIPEEWIEQIARRDFIVDICEKLRGKTEDNK